MSRNELIYLACPFRHQDLSIQRWRCAAATYVTGELFKKGGYVFSPLTHNGFLGEVYEEITKEHWMQFDLTVLGLCTKLVVLKLEGWQESKGVQREIEFAQNRGIIIEEMEAPEEGKVDLFIHTPIPLLLKKMTAFYAARDWDQFHSPKNLAIDLASEVGEVLDHFKWVTEKESCAFDADIHAQVKEEIGDAFRSLLYLAAKLGIDPIVAAEEKLINMEQRYPLDQARGKNLKYTAYERAQ